jgi:sugar/nucleoside kinase (ribokinase family)
MGMRADEPERDLDLLVVGEINPDVIVSDRDPRPVCGQAERAVRDIRLSPGSSSVITACGAARLGLRVAMVGVVGDDALGQYMVQAMAERGIDVSGVRVEPGVPTGASVILSDGRDRAILTAQGTIGAVTAADVPPALLARARHLHVGSWFLQDGLRPGAAGLFAAARANGLSTSLDPNWDPAGAWDGGIRAVLPRIDVFLPNDTEVRHLTGLDDVSEAAIALARSAGAEGSPLVVVKCGAAGALAANVDGVVVRVDAYPVDALDTTGAGDAFDAAFLAIRLDGGSVEAALRAGAFAGAASTTMLGGVDGQVDRATLDAALAEPWA